MWLFERLRQFKEQTAILWRDDPFTYRSLVESAVRWRSVLADHEVRPGTCVALAGDFSPETTSLLLALIENRNIIAPLSTSDASERRHHLQVVRAESVFWFDRADAWTFERIDKGDDHPLLAELRRRDKPGLILVSSGSTGEVKASVHGFLKLLAKFEKQPSRPFRSLPFLLLDHIGGINTLFYSLAGGGCLVGGVRRTVDDVCRAIERHRIELLPTTPTFLRMLLIAEAHKKYDLGSLKLISYGTEPMPEATLKSLGDALPDVQFKQTYGLTEVGILPTKSETSNSTWVKMGGHGYETRIVDGTLWIRTDSAMLGYLNAPSPFDEDGWLHTGDVVEVKDGYFRVLGRDCEIINVGGEKVFPAEVENVIQQMDNIQDVAVRGQPNPIVGTIVIARVEPVEPEEAEALERRIRDFCRDRLAPFKIPAVVEMAPGKLHGQRFKKSRKVEK